MCQLLGQAQQRGFAVVYVPGAKGKQDSSCCVPSQGGCRSEQLCFVVLKDARISDWFQTGFRKAKVVKHPNVSSG